MLSVSGCRGIFGRSITPEVAARFGAVYGTYLRGRAGAGGRPLVVLGRDGRLAGDVLARAAAAGLAGAGCDVLDVGVAMTPTVGVMVDARNAAGGLVVTASHNPQEWNGLKPMLREGGGSGAKAGEVAASAPNKAFADAIIASYREAVARSGRGEPASLAGPAEVGMISEASRGGLGLPDEATQTHLACVKEALIGIGAHDDRRSMGIKCVLDSVNASGRVAGKELLGRRLVHHLGASDNGIFPHTPEPTRENLDGLCRFAREKRADVGFAQDPDADRLAIVDERGEYIGEEYTLALCAEAVLGAMGEKARGGTVCVNLSTSRMIEDVCARHGVRVIRTAVGEANVVEAMKRNGSVFGGEGNGGVIWPRVTYIRDSLGGMGLILALMARTEKKISELVAEIPSYAIVKRKVDLAGGDPSQAARAVEAIKRAYAGDKLDTQDGVRVDFESKRAWLHVRGSNTEPIMRLIAEAPSEAVANQILDEAAGVIARG
jgi:phosphomannomutase